MRAKQLSRYSYVPILCGLASTGCSGVDSTEFISALRDDQEGTEVTIPVEESELYAEGEDRDQVDRDTEAFMATFDAEAGRVVKYDNDPYEESHDPREKGNWPALAGWAMTGALVFQDGMPELPSAPNPAATDHCSLFGRSCDGEWHLQATDISISGHADWMDGAGLKLQPTGARCGSDMIGWPPLPGNGPHSWYPCAIPYVGPTVEGRKMPWTFSATTCPNDATGREHIRQAMLSMVTYLEVNTTYRLPEATAANGLDPEIYIECSSTLPVGTAARWSPRDALTLRYAAPVQILESCESPGYPGSGSNGSEALYTQRVDMVYTYSKNTLFINWTSLFNFLTCTTNTTKIRRGIRNILLHEFGHAMTFAHDRYLNGINGVMEPELDCPKSTEITRGFSQPLRDTMEAFDRSTAGSLTLLDNDVSCLKPYGQ